MEFLAAIPYHPTDVCVDIVLFNGWFGDLAVAALVPMRKEISVRATVILPVNLVATFKLDAFVSFFKLF
jgi:hypothetical protein